MQGTTVGSGVGGGQLSGSDNRGSVSQWGSISQWGMDRGSVGVRGGVGSGVLVVQGSRVGNRGHQTGCELSLSVGAVNWAGGDQRSRSVRVGQRKSGLMGMGAHNDGENSKEEL